MEYRQIFHVMRIGKYYCKNMKYRINIYMSVCLSCPKMCRRKYVAQTRACSKSDLSG